MTCFPVSAGAGGGQQTGFPSIVPARDIPLAKGARDDFGDRSHFAIPIFPVSDESPSSRAGRISPNTRCPNRGEQDRRRYLERFAHADGLCSNRP